MTIRELAASMDDYRQRAVTVTPLLPEEGFGDQAIPPEVWAAYTAQGDLDEQAVTRLLYDPMPDPRWTPYEFGPRVAGFSAKEAMG